MNRKTQEGFTLLEVLIALAIFSFGILGIASMQVTSIQGNAYASGLTEAATWAQDRMERLTALNYTHANLNDTDGDDGGPGVGGGLDDIGGNADYQVVQGIYTINWNIAEDFPLDNTKTIRVIVVWNENGRQITLPLDCVKSSQ
ncbi:MAG: prepilin-type N-terminal cleavage/methylation domain-containing protein [Thermodesulfobacteriota bacterium]|nr:prepilin-type N-terminal cleavage/methylation domain-containing protein [Thermodesulfobacteriota bacterium]